MATVGENNVINHGANPWWQEYSANDLKATFTTGTISEASVSGQKVWTAFSARAQMDGTPMGTILDRHFKSKGYNWDDVSDRIVWQDRPQDVPGVTIYFVPIASRYNSGRARYDIEYIGVKFNLDAAAIETRKAEEALALETARLEAKRARDALKGTGGGATPYGSVSAEVIDEDVPRPGKELSLFEGPGGRIWYAGTPKESGSKSGPHPDITLAGKEVWNTAEWGKPAENGLPANLYLVTMDEVTDVGTVRPAGKEFNIVMQRAQQGDDGAQEVLQWLGVDTGGGGGMGGFFSKFLQG